MVPCRSHTTVNPSSIPGSSLKKLLTLSLILSSNAGGHPSVMSMHPSVMPHWQATLEATLNSNGIMYRLAVAFGEVSIPAGGLVVNDVPYKGAVALKAGEAIAWQV